MISDSCLRLFRKTPTPTFKHHRHFSTLPPEHLLAIGTETGLRVTGPITADYDYRGYCLGASLTLISCLLRQQEPVDFDRLYTDYRAAMNNVILLQKLQDQLAGTGGRCSAKLLNIFNSQLLNKDPIPLTLKKASPPTAFLYENFQQFLNESLSCSLRKYLIERLELQGYTLSPRLYALILEIEGNYEKLRTPTAHRFHKLQQEILHELSALSGFNILELVAVYGNEKTVVKHLNDLTVGIYYISFSRHAFVYIKEESDFNWLWDSMNGFKKCSFSESGKKFLAKSLRGCYTTKTNWITISKCLKKEDHDDSSNFPKPANN